MDLRSEAEVGTIDSIKTIDLLEKDYEHIFTKTQRTEFFTART